MTSQTSSKSVSKNAKNARRPIKRIALAIAGTVAALGLLVLLARWIREVAFVQDFLATYPGEVPLKVGAPVGLPAWIGWQHFLNSFFMLLIIRSGWLVRTTKRPAAYWTHNNRGLIRTKVKPSKISLDLWLHLTLDALWVANGLVFIVLLFATGQWVRVVPTNWEFVPNALSAALQYASLSWPSENGWVNYNSLQVIAYFVTIFIAAPVAAVSGIRMSKAWPANASVNRFFPIELARAVHFPVMLYFVLFIVVHITLVLTSGALRNLNHMYAAQDSVSSWLGFTMFAVSVLIMVAAWAAARPTIMRPLAQLSGKVGR